MKAKTVTVSFEYTNFDCLETMIERLKSILYGEFLKFYFPSYSALKYIKQ